MIISCKTFFKSMLISEYPKPNMDLFWEVLFRQTEIFVDFAFSEITVQWNKQFRCRNSCFIYHSDGLELYHELQGFLFDNCA